MKLDDNTNIQLKEKELLLIKNMTVTGSCTQTLIREHIGEKRLRLLCDKGIFHREKPHKIEVDGKLSNRYAYSLGLSGQKFALEQGYCFKIQGHNGYEHTQKMERVVEDLLKNQEISIKNIYNEKEQLEIFKKEIYQARRHKVDFRVNDIAYKTEDGIWESVEITTSNYGPKLNRKHEQYAVVIGANYTKI